MLNVIDEKWSNEKLEEFNPDCSHFIPPLTRAFKEGWKPHTKIREEGAFRRSSHIVMSYTGFAPGRLERIFDDIDEGEGEEE